VNNVKVNQGFVHKHGQPSQQIKQQMALDIPIPDLYNRKQLQHANQHS
jgi:hypothetical protein